jgi:hypothetical protein
VSKYSRDRRPPVESGDLPGKPPAPKRRIRPEVVRGFYALGPIPLSVAGAAGRAGPWCMSVLLAIRAWTDMKLGAPVPPTWLAVQLGANVRTVQRAMSALIEAGLVARSDGGLVLPSWSKLARQVRSSANASRQP